MKSEGNKSRFASSASTGFINTFANGVAVYPTYDAIGNLLKIDRIQRFIVVGLSPFAVLGDALSASSSIMSMLFESIPCCSSSAWSLSLTLSRMLFTFFTTRTTGLLKSLIVALRFFCTNFAKSLLSFVNGTAKCSCGSKPTPTYSIELPILSLLAPITPRSVRFWVCRRRELVVPAKRTTIL